LHQNVLLFNLSQTWIARPRVQSVFANLLSVSDDEILFRWKNKKPRFR